MKREIRAVVLGALLVGAGPALPVSAAFGMSANAGQSVQVVRTVPADMAADVQAGTPLTVEFGGTISQAFYQTINLNLFRNGQPIEGELFYNPAARQVMFKPKVALQAGQMYTAQLSFGDGVSGTAEKMWNFRVSTAAAAGSAPASYGATSMQTGGASAQTAINAGVAATRLLITNANMAGGMINPQNPLEVSFSEALDITSLKDAPVKLMCNQETVGVDYRLSRDLKTLTLIPRQPLKSGTEYGIAINKALSGSSGSRLPKNTVIPFRIGGANGSAIDVEVPDNVLEEAPSEAAMPVSVTPRRQGLVNTARFEAPVSEGYAEAPVQSAVPLKLVGMSPQSGTTVTNLTQPVTLAFNQEVRPETLNEFTFRVEDDFGPVPAKIQYLSGQKRAVLTPVGVLDANRSYRVIITQGVTDVTGRPLQNALAATFATSSPAAAPAIPEAFAAAPSAPARRVPQAVKQPVMRETIQESRELEGFEDESGASSYGNSPSMEADADWNSPSSRQAARTAVRQAPREALSTFKVTGILPASNAEQVARNSKIIIHFSEPAQQSTVNPINISVFGRQERVEGRVSYDARKKRAIFIPASPLEADTQYKVLISDKIKSQAGEQLVARYSWQFTTQNERQARRVSLGKPRRSAEADSAFYIPLADGRAAMPQAVATARMAQSASSAGTGFVYVPANHWVFKSLKRVISKGLLPGMPFYDVSKVTRYEFASAIRSALENLRGLSGQQKTKLRVGDLVELEQLVIAFRSELRSFSVDTAWFENFLASQGVSIADVERRVGLNSSSRAG